MDQTQLGGQAHFKSESARKLQTPVAAHTALGRALFLPSEDPIQHAVLFGFLPLPVLPCLLWSAQLCCFLTAGALDLLLSFGICGVRH